MHSRHRALSQTVKKLKRNIKDQKELSLIESSVTQLQQSNGENNQNSLVKDLQNMITQQREEIKNLKTKQDTR